MTDDDDMSEVVAEFLVESHENLEELDHSLLELERDPANRDVVGSIFRTMHTIKGTSGFLGFDHLQGLTHAAESFLSGLRDGTFQLSPASTTALFATVDAVRSMLASIEANGDDGTDSRADIVAQLERLQDPAASDVQLACADPLGDESHLGESEEVDVDAGEPSARPAVQPAAPADDAEVAAQDRWEESTGAAASSTIRVDVAQLDKLMNLVGELVLARNQILQCTAEAGDASFVATAQRLNLITSELQEGVMKTRMQPIGTVWSKFPRVVRDLAVACGKQIRLDMDGRETELDKTLIEAIKDPLTHLVRNAVDHGIEPTDRRLAAGKPAEGRLTLRAYHESGHVSIEIADDGSGIDTGRVRAKAVAKGLVSAEAAERMPERELMGLIFLPGFSTAETVTNVSGRGVGMDVVKTNIERIGGRVDVSSDPGVGTTFRITIPLTLAIVPALIVTAAGDRYAIPQVNLIELVRLKTDGGAGGIELVHGVPVHRLRGTLLPLVNLSHELGLCEDVIPDDARGAFNIVVLQAADQQFGLIVDEISDTEEIVVKPLSQQLKSVGAFAGATIMGDGRVALILDVVGLAHRAAVLAELRELLADDPIEDAGDLGDSLHEALLIVGVGEDQRMAVSLSAVNRLEEFPPAAVELAGDLRVVQYRNSLLPLIHVASTFGVSSETTDREAPLQVVVHHDGRRSIGLVVDRIIDIVEERVTVHREGAVAGIIGSAIILGHVTDIVDLPTLTASVRLPAPILREVA